MKPVYVLLPLAVIILCLIYLFQGAEGNLSFIQMFRLPTLLGLATVAAAIGVSTVLFQTLTGNRILTPSLVGFDALYVLIQTSIVFFFGSVDYLNLPPLLKFAGESFTMIALSLILFGSLLIRLQSDLTRLILTGVIFGVLFRSLAGFMKRIMSPNDYAVVQSGSYASFSNIDETTLPFASAAVLISLLIVLRISHRLDVMALGRDIAIGLGVNYDRTAFLLMTLIAILVTTSTALAGPVVFLGLIISSLSYRLVSSHKHVVLVPIAACTGIFVVITGQLIFERILGMSGTISTVIELLGGLLFLYLLLRRKS